MYIAVVDFLTQNIFGACGPTFGYICADDSYVCLMPFHWLLVRSTKKECTKGCVNEMKKTTQTNTHYSVSQWEERHFKIENETKSRLHNY